VITLGAREYVHSTWEHRPFWMGGEMNFLPDSYEEASADLNWHIAIGATLHTLGYSLGAREMVGPWRATNILIGEMFGLYRPGQVVQTARGTHITGSAMSATQWAWFHRVKMMPVLRGLSATLRFVNPIFTLGWIGYELYANRSSQRPGHAERTVAAQAHYDMIRDYQANWGQNRKDYSQSVHDN